MVTFQLRLEKTVVSALPRRKCWCLIGAEIIAVAYCIADIDRLKKESKNLIGFRPALISALEALTSPCTL